MKEIRYIEMKFWERWDNISYMWTNGLLKTLPDTFTDNISPSVFYKKIKLICKDLTADFLKLFKKTAIPHDKIWFLALTKNNYDALKIVQQTTPDSIFVSFLRFRSSITKDTYYFSLSRKFLYDLIYPFTWGLYALHNRRKAVRYYDLLFTVNGTYPLCKRLLRKSKPKSIVFTNDHLVIARALLLAAKSLGINTYYIPHASVSEYFPPLEFDFALLDGQDALEKYRKCGQVASEVHLVGMPKFDDYADKLNQNPVLTTLGIAYNMVDKLQDVIMFCEHICALNPELKILLRPHPGDVRKIPELKSIDVSDSRNEGAFDFLCRIDALVSGESSIHLEAVLLNVYPMYYNFSPTNRFDFYGFIRNGLVEYFDTIESLNQKIQELQSLKPNVQEKAKYFNAAVGTDFYGRSTQKISKLILETTNA